MSEICPLFILLSNLLNPFDSYRNLLLLYYLYFSFQLYLLFTVTIAKNTRTARPTTSTLGKRGKRTGSPQGNSTPATPPAKRIKPRKLVYTPDKEEKENCLPLLKACYGIPSYLLNYGTPLPTSPTPGAAVDYTSSSPLSLPVISPKIPTSFNKFRDSR